MIRSIFGNFARAWREHFAMQLATLFVLTGIFTVVTFSVFLQRNLTRILTYWGNEVQLTVFLKESVGTSEKSAVQKFLDDSGEFTDVTFVAKDEAAAKFEKQMGNYAPHLLSDPEFGNPLPASFETKLKKGLSSDAQYARLVGLAESIRQLAGVDEVSYGQGWIENYASVLRFISSSGWVLVLILLSGSLLAVSNSIRSSIYQRREEIEILELVGATPAMIRVPYVFEGFIMGATSGILSVCICYLLFLWQQSAASSHMGFWGIASQVGFIGVQDAIGCVLLSGLFGVLGAYSCVHRLATGWAAAERIKR